MSLRRGKHALHYPHRQLTGTSAPSASGQRRCGGEC
jgi:hypothetical protein